MRWIRILELRQYALRSGQRDVLIDLFDREFIETQESAGMAILGQFRDLDNPDSFVWLRGFQDLPSRAESLARFYGGPAWKAHARQANATMVDIDNVLLLRPVSAGSGFPPATRPPIGAIAPTSAILATIHYRDRPFDEAFAELFDRQLRPALLEAGAPPVACFQTEYAENNFPALPLRTGVHAFVWFARFPSLAHLDRHLVHSDAWPGPALTTQRLRLLPTARSLVR